MLLLLESLERASLSPRASGYVMFHIYILRARTIELN